MPAVKGITNLSFGGQEFSVEKCDNLFPITKEDIGIDSLRDEFTNVLGRKFRELGTGFKTLSACATIVNVEANKLIDALAIAYPAPEIKVVSHGDPARNLVETTWFYRVPRKMKKKMRKDCRNQLFTTITIPSNVIEINGLPYE